MRTKNTAAEQLPASAFLFAGNRITAAAAGALTVSFGAPVTASATSRTLGGPVVRYGEYGRTSAGRLRVAAGALRFPDDLTRVKLTREHDRGESRGYLASLDDSPEQLYVRMKVSDGTAGDDALAEAADHTRDGFSFDIVDAVIEGDTITSALVIAIGQVGIPAYDDMRIDTIAASATNNEGNSTMTEEQRARLAELRSQSNLTEAEQAELEQLAQLESAEQQDSGQASDSGEQGEQGEQGGSSATASRPNVPAVPSGVRRPAATTRERGGHLRRFVQALERGLSANGPGVTAALQDVTNTGADGGVLSQPAWSGELWSGVQHEREFVPLLNHGDLTNWKGEGWRWVTKPEMKDYAGDKAAIPSDPVDTEPSNYTAARMAVGHDIDRKFYDFPDSAFIESYLAACRESWSVKSDMKARAFIETTAVPVMDGVTPVSRPTILKAAARAMRAVKRNTRTRGTFVMLSDNDFDQLMDVSEHDVPAFLELFDVDPKGFTSSPDVADGTVIAGTKQAATFRELPGSPLRVSAQHIANGGVDEAFFGYWAVEQHHESGIVSVQFDPAP